MPLGILILSLLLGIVATRLILLPVDLLYLLHVPGWLLLAGLLVLASWLLGE